MAKVAGTGLMSTLADWAAKADADVVIQRTEGDPEWTVMANFGREAPDSPMAAGSILGSDTSPTTAIEQALREVRINPCAECGWEQACIEGCHT